MRLNYFSEFVIYFSRFQQSESHEKNTCLISGVEGTFAAGRFRKENIVYNNMTCISLYMYMNGIYLKKSVGSSSSTSGHKQREYEPVA